MKRVLSVAVAVFAVVALGGAAPASAEHRLGSGRERDDPSRRPDGHRRRAVHRELRVLRRVEHRLHRPGRALLGHRRLRPRPTAATRARSRRHAGRGRRRQPARARMVYNSWLTMQARGETRRRHLRSTTTSRWSGSTRPTSPRSTRRSRSGAARPASTRRPRPARACYSTATRRCAAASRQLSPKQGIEPRRRRRRLEPHRLHRHARHPRRLGQRVPRRARAARSAC